MKSPCILVTGPNKCELSEVEIPDINANEILVENVLTGISPGTELRCLGGSLPPGSSWPYVPGYCGVGRVIKAGRDSGFTEGAWVTTGGTARLQGACKTWGGHVAHVIGDAGNSNVIGPGVPFGEAIASRLAGIPYRGVRLSAPQPHDTVVVVGLGMIGHLAARLYAHCGSRVLAVDTSAARVAAIRAAGIEALQSGPDLVASVKSILPGGADIVVDCTGVPAVAPKAIKILREMGWGLAPEVRGGRFVLQGTIDGNFTLDYWDLFFREANILVPRDTAPGDRRVMADLISSRKLRLDGVVGEIAAPSDCLRVYEQLKARDNPVVTAAFRWKSGDATA